MYSIGYRFWLRGIMSEYKENVRVRPIVSDYKRKESDYDYARNQ